MFILDGQSEKKVNNESLVLIAISGFLNAVLFMTTRNFASIRDILPVYVAGRLPRILQSRVYGREVTRKGSIC